MFCGAVRFTAHQDLMRLVVADPWIHLSGRHGQLSIAAGTAGTAGSRIVVADLEIPEPTRRGELLCWAAAGARLAEDGAVAFDFNYPPGTELSPVSFSWPADESVLAVPAAVVHSPEPAYGENTPGTLREVPELIS
jgi:hypothetical protein